MKSFKIIISSAMALLSLAASAQHTWTLDSCINHAINNSITVKNQQIQVESGQIDVEAAKDRYLPNISGYASQSMSFGRGLTADNTYTNRNTSNFGWGVNLSLPLFQGLATYRQNKYAKANLRVMVEELEATKDNVELNVISAYLQALYTGEILGVAREQLRLSQIEEARRADLLAAGKIAELELTQARAQVAQNQVTVVNAENDSVLALIDLAQLLQLPDIEGFKISPIDTGSDRLLAADNVYERALTSNHSIIASRHRIEAADRNISLAQSSYLPTLSFNAGLGSNYYTVNGFDSESFSQQMRNNFNKSLGFSLSVPIFDGFSTRNNVRRAKVQKINAQLQYESNRQTLYKAIQQAYYQARGAQQRYESSVVSESATHEAYLAMQKKYEYGKANATEYEQALSDYIRARSQTVQAKYETLLRLRILDFYNK